MGGKWVQAENGKDEKLDIYVWTETPDAATGTAQVVSSAATPQLLGPDGRPLSPGRRRFGFDPKDARR